MATEASQGRRKGRDRGRVPYRLTGERVLPGHDLGVVIDGVVRGRVEVNRLLPPA